MNKLLVVFLAVVALAGCKTDNKIDAGDGFNPNDFEIVCLNGVNYYMRATAKHGYMAPVYETVVEYNTDGTETKSAKISLCI